MTTTHAMIKNALNWKPPAGDRVGGGEFIKQTRIRFCIALVGNESVCYRLGMPAFLRLFLTVSIPLFILDFVTKEWAVRTFPAPEPDFTGHIVVVENFFELVRVHNTGVAFGMGNGGEHSNWIFGGVSFGALLFLSWMWRTGAFPTKLSKLAVALLVSGVLGNLLDRFLRGYVVDFLLFHLGKYSWPAFNVADSCICIAAGFLFISAFQKQPEPSKSA